MNDYTTSGRCFVHSGPRHARKKQPRRQAAPLRAGLAVTAAGAAVAGAAGMANAAEPSRVGTPLGDFDTTVAHKPAETPDVALGPVSDLRADPPAGTGSDPLADGVGTQVADFEPVGTQDLTGPLAQGASLDELPQPRVSAA